jgi:hypothetical protein
MTELGKTINLRRGMGLAICMLIGTGILALPGLALGVGNVHEAILGWLLITFLTIPRIQICSRLGLKFPSTAGLAGYAEEAVGPWGGYSVSYLVGGSFFFGLPAVALIGSEYMRQLFTLSESGVALFAILLVTLMFISNLFGIRAITLINYLALAVLFLLIGLLIVFNLDFLGSGLGIARVALNGSGNIDLNNIWKITSLLFWAFLGWENLSFSLGEMKDPEKNIPRLYWLSFALVAALYISLALISVGASAAGVSIRGAAGLSGLVLFTPGSFHARWKLSYMAYNCGDCSKCMFVEFYCKPSTLCRRQDRNFPFSIRKALKEEYSCIQPCGPICSVCFPYNGKLRLQGSCDIYDAARKPELYFPLWFYHNCLLENRNWVAKMGILGSFAIIPELFGLRIYLEDCISDFSNRAWLLQVYGKKGRSKSFAVQTDTPSA